MKLERSITNYPRGQYLIEVLVGLGVFTILATALGTLMLDASTLRLATSASFKEEWLLRQGREALLSIEKSGWDNLAIGTFGISKSNNFWELTSAPQVIGNYKQQITIDWLERNSVTGDIEEPGIPDILGKKSVLEILRASDDSVLASETIYHTTPLSNVWKETTIADFGDGVFSNTETFLLEDGIVTLAQTGESAEGFPFAIDGFTTINLSSQTRALAYRFTPSTAAQYTEARIYVSFIRGVSPTYRIGLQSLTPTGEPSGVWLGTTQTSYGSIQPQNAGWQSVSFLEPASVTAGQTVAMVIQWQNGTVNNNNHARFIEINPRNAITPYNGFPQVELQTLYRNTTTWNEQDLDPIFVLMENTTPKDGVPYTSTTSSSIMSTQSMGQRYLVKTENEEVLGVRFLVARNNLSPNQPLLVTIRDITSDTTLYSDTIALPQDVNQTFRWVESQFPNPIALPANHSIRMELSSTTSTNRPYVVPLHSTQFASEYLAMGFGGTDSYSETFRTVVSEWLGSPAADMPFLFIKPGGPAQSGTYVSSIFDSGNSATRFSALLWDASIQPGTTVQVQLRTGATIPAIQNAPWQGPDGTDQTSFLSPSALYFSPANSTRYIQYQITLTSDGAMLPAFREITIAYE